MTVLWDFTGGEEGGNPRAGLLHASDGSFYGTTGLTIFRIGTTGPLANIHTFSGTDGVGPHATLIEDSAGNLLGTTEGGGASDLGTIFRTDINGTLTTLHEFSGPDGRYPRSELLLASDGNLYGTTGNGGASDAGLIYRLVPPAGPSLDALSPSSGRAAGGSALEIQGEHLQPGLAVILGGAPAVGVVNVDSKRARAVSPTLLSPGTLNDLVVTNPDSSSATLPSAWFADFLDVPSTSLFHDSVETIVRAGITAGCGGGNYCVGSAVTRAQMAVFLLKAEHGSAYAPPACTGVFGDVACPGGFAVDWIEQLAAEGVTSGCGGGNYCPDAPVTRAQMAVFLLKTLLGSAYAPPVVAQVFDDVPPGAFAYDWINDLSARAITGGCSVSPLLYCPSNSNARGQMAVFLVRTFGL